MKKKLVLMAILLIIGVILFLENVCKISIFYNIKNIMDKQVKMYNNEEKITKLNVTGIEPGKETNHEHLYKTLYDESKHWEECMACGERRNEVKHTFQTTWTAGKESCEKNNNYTKSCVCGYSYTGHKPHVLGTAVSHITGQAQHQIGCKVCLGYMYKGQSYYIGSYGSGSLYEITDKDMQCYKKDKTIPSCKNPGTCVSCGKKYTSNLHNLVFDESGKIYCYICSKEFGTLNPSITKTSDIPITYTVITEYKFNDGVTYKRNNGIRNIGTPFSSTNTSIISGGVGKNNVKLKSTATFKTTWKEIYSCWTDAIIDINGEENRITYAFSITPDYIAPTITNIITENEEILTIWSRTKPIIISGQENYCNTVKVEILDDEENTFFTGNAVVTNGSYTISCTPEVEAGINGRRFKVIVTDACDNKTEQEFEIARVDAIAPKITSRDELGGDWAKSKKITFSANDYGIGEVQIGFNSSDDYVLASKNGQSYSREYELFGDVYEPREANVYYKDGLGNISTKKIIIDKLDNTVPTITNVNIHNNKLTVEANDIHEIWGEGSGIVKYRYLSSGNKISNIDILEFISEVDVEDNIVIPNLPEVKYVYVVAEDLVRKYK